MKNFLSLLVMLIAVSSVNASDFNWPESPVGISVVKNGNIVKLYYKGEQAGMVKVTIFDAEGDPIFSETMRKTDNFMRPYNFSSLRAGEYTIELSDAQGKRRQKVTHSLERAAHLSRVDKNENKYLLVVPNKGKDALTVKVFNDQNDLLYQHTETIEGDFGKVYDLSEVEGAWVFRITDQQGMKNRLAKP